jgi:acyl dehydratase
MRTFATPRALAGAVGTELGVSSWHTVTQELIDAFADATGDHQWIHVDQERARLGPFGATIAHGYLTLSLIPMLMHEIYEVQDARMAVNYGLNRVRFPAPVRVGSSVRARATLSEAEPTGDAIQVVTHVTIEVEGQEKPACVADVVSRFQA